MWGFTGSSLCHRESLEIMRALSSAELLNVWERGLAASPTQRALTLLASACPDTPPDTLAELSIGQRDARLLTLREWTFGPQFVSTTVCPGCDERLELAFNVQDLRIADSTGELADPLSLSVQDYEVRCRLPDSTDLAAIAHQPDVAAARQALLQRCVLSARRRQEEVVADQLPDEVVQALVEKMAEADPLANIVLAMSCPACQQRWQAVLDIVAYFWSELNAWALRLLREVHTLAAAYGWAEAEIVAMGPARRRIYLDMVSQ